MNKGPEDDPAWTRLEENSLSNSIDVCRLCGKAIEQWHCDDLGCPWCEACGSLAKEKK